MTAPTIAAADLWWLGRKPAHFIATEIVGPDAVADLVAARLRPGALLARERDDIRPITDRLALMAAMSCRRRARSTRELAELCRVTPSGMWRAISIAADRLIAVELKLENWISALSKAEAYLRWANAAWVVLGRVASTEALDLARASGIGLARLDKDGQLICLVRAHGHRRAACPWTAAWAAEQVLARAESARTTGRRATCAVTAGSATLAGAPALALP